MSKTLDEIMAQVVDYGVAYSHEHSDYRDVREALRTRLDSLVADAERYFHLKQSYTQCGAAWIAIGIHEDDPDKWDTIIDAARATQQIGEQQ